MSLIPRYGAAPIAGLLVCPWLTLALASSTAADDLSEGGDKEPASRWEYLAQRYDKNGDGRISKKEYDRDKLHWDLLDTDGNGYIEAVDVEGAKKGTAKKGGGQAAGRELEVGETAPLFSLSVLPEEGIESLSTKNPKTETISLKSFRSDRPVALIFGSYT